MLAHRPEVGRHSRGRGRKRQAADFRSGRRDAGLACRSAGAQGARRTFVGQKRRLRHPWPYRQYFTRQRRHGERCHVLRAGVRRHARGEFNPCHLCFAFSRAAGLPAIRRVRKGPDHGSACRQRTLVASRAGEPGAPVQPGHPPDRRVRCIWRRLCAGKGATTETRGPSQRHRHMRQHVRCAHGLLGGRHGRQVAARRPCRQRCRQSSCAGRTRCQRPCRCIRRALQLVSRPRAGPRCEVSARSPRRPAGQ